MSKIWNNTLQNMEWRVHDGQNVSFWKDDWLKLGYPLHQKSLVSLTKDQLKATMLDFVNDDRELDWDLLQHLLPTDMWPKICSVYPPKQDARSTSAV